MKKVVSIITCIVLALSFSSCKLSSRQQEEQAKNEREKYIEDYLWRLNKLRAVIDESFIDKNSNDPWDMDIVYLPDSETIVSLYVIRTKIHIYELDTGNETELTAEDIVDLYTVPNEEKQAEFDEFFDWYYGDRFAGAQSRYYRFIYETDNFYKETYGKPFIDKDIDLYTADERYALVKWGIENIEGNYYKEKMNEVEKTSQ